MEESIFNLNHNEYLQFIVESLHMKMDNFMFFLLSEDEGCYEYIIYKWTLNLYEKGKKPEQALPIIYRARSIYLMHSVYLTPAPSEPTEKLKNLLVAMLPSNSNYKSLSKKEQEIVQQKIAQLTKTDDAKEIVAHVLESMNPLLEVEEINNTIIIGNGTLDRIKDRIRKANLSKYQKNKKT